MKKEYTYPQINVAQASLEMIPLPNSFRIQRYRRIWLSRIIDQLKRHFGSSTQN